MRKDVLKDVLQPKHNLVQPAERLYQWFSVHDPDTNVRYRAWQELDGDQQAYWIQAVQAAFGAEAVR